MKESTPYQVVTGTKLRSPGSCGERSLRMQPGHHRRISSQWIPSGAPLTDYLNLANYRQKDSDSSRIITPNICVADRHTLENSRRYNDNEITTTKYNPLTFIPKNLWEQFHRVANFYFLIVIALEWFPQFSIVPNPMVATMPFVFILALTAIKDALEDLRRRRLDSRVNNANCHVWDSSAGRFRKLSWNKILVGDLVHISNDEIFPADILLLRCSSDDGNTFMETSNLDGESNLKHRSVPKLFTAHCGEDIIFQPSIHLRQFVVTCSAPSKDISEINGTIAFSDRKEAFNATNMLLRGCRLKNTTFAEGIVIYAGHDTKLMLNNGRARYKRSQSEKQTNAYIFGCAALLAVLIAVTTIFRIVWLSYYPCESCPVSWNNCTCEHPMDAEFAARTTGIPDWVSTLATSVSTYQLIIPLSLYITVELIKAGQAYLMSQDLKMYSEEKDEAFIARSLSTGEELGQLTHVLSDKTGTLTQNKMILRHCATVASSVETEGKSLSPESDPLFQQLLTNMIVCNSVFVQTSPRKDVIDAGFYEDGIYTIGNSHFFTYTEDEFAGRVAELEADDDDDEPAFEGESPDEIALVKGAGLFGYQLIGRASGAVHMKMPDGSNRTLNVLCTLPFDATRKRMSVCVESETDDDVVIVYTKGADSAMFHDDAHHERRLSRRRRKRRETARSHLGTITEEEHPDEEDDAIEADQVAYHQEITILRRRVDEFSRLGLRTLVLGMRSMSRDDFDAWHEWYQMAEQSKGDAEAEKVLIEMAEKLEKDSRPIGVTAVEDKLQEGVPECIAKLRQAGIQVWVLTGDKKETAEGVANACGLFRGEPIHFDCLSTEEDEPLNGTDVVVSPKVIAALCESADAIKSFDACSSVLCYRMTPAQKAEIVKAVRKNGGRVLAVGDGANDVPMIQAANVGIGISGSEGMQASMAADFVIAQFAFLGRLLLLHGTWNYARLSSVLLFFLYKNGQNVMMTLFVQVYNGWSGGYPVDATYSMIYPIIFTSLQPLLFGMYEQDEREEVLMDHPEKYAAGREGTRYNFRLFLINMADAAWQGFVCYFFCHNFIEFSCHSVPYFGFTLATSMFLINICHLLLETRCINAPVVLVHTICIALHFGFNIVYTEICLPTIGLDDNELNIAVEAMADADFWACCFISVVVALFPRFVTLVLVNTSNLMRERATKTKP